MVINRRNRRAAVGVQYAEEPIPAAVFIEVIYAKFIVGGLGSALVKAAEGDGVVLICDHIVVAIPVLCANNFALVCVIIVAVPVERALAHHAAVRQNQVVLAVRNLAVFPRTVRTENRAHARPEGFAAGKEIIPRSDFIVLRRNEHLAAFAVNANLSTDSEDALFHRKRLRRSFG